MLIFVRRHHFNNMCLCWPYAPLMREKTNDNARISPYVPYNYLAEAGLGVNRDV